MSSRKGIPLWITYTAHSWYFYHDTKHHLKSGLTKVQQTQKQRGRKYRRCYKAEGQNQFQMGLFWG